MKSDSYLHIATAIAAHLNAQKQNATIKTCTYVSCLFRSIFFLSIHNQNESAKIYNIHHANNAIIVLTASVPQKQNNTNAVAEC